MSNYPNTTLTNAGQDLIAESIAEGKALIFTKVELGDGNLSAGQSISTLTALISSKMNVPLSSGSADNGQAKLRFAVGNSGLEEGFFAREVGVFAKAGADGVETLYAYTNGGNYVDFIPDQSRPIDDQIMDVYIVTGNAAEVQIQVDSAAYATVADLNEHNESADSHPLTIDDTVAPTSDTAPMPTILNNVANMLKAISGESGWKGVPGKSLAALVSSLSTGITVAADGTFSNPTLGISGLMATNGYICFGPNFGGLILQWGTGKRTTSNFGFEVPFPITFPNGLIQVLASSTSTNTAAGVVSSTNSAITLWAANQNGGASYVAIGR